MPSTTVSSIAADADELLAVAQRLERAADRPALPAEVAGSLHDVEETLRALDRVVLGAASRLMPPGDLDDGPGDRYRRAAGRWPDPAPPSYERQAELLASLHDAAATVRAAAECCRRAHRVLVLMPGAGDGRLR